jgi:chemotaxis protein histidine kinase CheA
MGGVIEATSAVGQGSTFTLTVPISVDSDSAKSVSRFPAGGAQAN